MIKSDSQILKTLTIEELQEQHRGIAEAVGVEGLISLTETFGGSSIYIPQKKELIKNRVYQNILQEYDGTNIKELTVKYDVCESTVYKIVRDKIVKGSTKRQIPGQINFADIGL